MFLDTSSKHESSPWHSCTSVVFRSCSEVTFQSDKFLWMIFNLAALLTPICSTQTLAEKDPSDARPRQTISERVCLCAPSVLVWFFFLVFFYAYVWMTVCVAWECAWAARVRRPVHRKRHAAETESTEHMTSPEEVCVCVCVCLCVRVRVFVGTRGAFCISSFKTFRFAA